MATEIIRGLKPNQRFWIAIKFGLLISLIEIISQFNLKKGILIYGILGYTLVATILFYALTFEGLGHMNLIWSCMSIITCYTLGRIYFDEPFNRFTIIAIVLALTAIYFAHRSDEL